MQVNVQIRLIELLQKVSKLLRGEGSRSQCFDIHIRRNHGSGMNLLGAIHEDLHGMDLQVLRIILTPHPLQFLKTLLCIPRIIDHEAAVNIHRQLSLQVQLMQAFVNLLVELCSPRDTGVKYCTNSVFGRKIDPAFQRCINLFIGQFHRTVENNRNFCCNLNHISGHMSVFPYIEGKSRHGIQSVVIDAVLLKDPGVHPDTVPLSFLDQDLSVRTDCIELLFYDILSVQVYFLQGESVPLLPRILPDIFRHNVQRFLFAVRRNAFPRVCILKANRHGHMDMAVKDTGHDELSAEVRDLSLIPGKAGLIAHIDEFPVLHHKGGSLGMVFVSCKDFCVFNDTVCLHLFFSCIFFPAKYTSLGLL